MHKRRAYLNWHIVYQASLCALIYGDLHRFYERFAAIYIARVVCFAYSDVNILRANALGYGSGNRKKYHVAGGNIGVGRMLALNIACFDRITSRIVCKRRGIPCRKRKVYYEMLLNS